MKRATATIALALLLLLPARAQESLTTLVDREYVEHWLVCGPFAPDVDGGLLAAVTAGGKPLGDIDHMKPRGGVTKMRPQHLDIIETDEGDAVWQRAGATDYTLDLSPFYPSAREGITYAGFYANSDAARTVYVDLQTPLGARVWLNGYLLRDVRPVPLSAAGRDQFLAPFRAGENFFLIETPGAAFEELAKALGMTERELSARGLVSRPLLQGKSGFEIALRIRPALPLGTGENAVAVVSKLASEGTYSGQASAPRQDYSLTLFNNASAPTAPLGVAIKYSPVDAPQYVDIGAVPGKAAKDTRISVPLSKLPEGESLPLEITVTDGTLTTTFTQSIQRDTSIQPGKMYVLTGPHWLSAATKWPPEAAWADAFARQSLQTKNDSNYGFVLGPQAVWEAALLAQPDALAGARDAVLQGQCAAESAYAACDPRHLSPELLYRNLVLGKLAARAVLNDAAPASIPWNAGGLPQQLPQLLNTLDLPGAITGEDGAGIPELSQWIGPDGTTAWLRRKEPARGPLGLAELRQMVAMQRRELLARGFSTDVLVDQAATAPPEPFLAGQAEELARSVPGIIIRGSGEQSFFEDLRASAAEKLDALPRVAWPMDEYAPATVRSSDALWQAHFRAQALLDSAQRFSTFAGLYGSEYAAAPLAKAERALLYLAAYAMPDADDDAFTDALSETRQAAGLVAEVLKDSTAYLATQVDTLRGAPLETQGVRALVVFNPSSWTRTDVVSAEVTVPAQGAVRLLDDEANEVPARYGTPRVVDARTRSLWITFTAKDVPGIGLRTFYLAPAPQYPPQDQRPDLMIENEYFELSVERASGDVERIVLKESDESLLTGPANSVALLPDDVVKRKTERGVWVDGAPTRATGTPEIRTSISPAMQEITVRQSFAGGKLVRSVRLYAGMREVDFETRLEGGETDGLVAASFSIGAPESVAVSGTAFGANVRAGSDADLDYRTGENAGLHPALYWTARAPGEEVQIGTEGGVPFLPAVIVHGPAQPLRDAAQSLAAALAKRGVPVKVLPATIEKPDFLWSDSTEFESHDDAWAHGMRMRFVIGSPEQNVFCSEVVKGQSPETIKLLSDRAPQGVVAFVSDARAKDRPGVPTFLMLGSTATQSAQLVPQLVREIESRGTYTLPASAYIPDQIPKSPERGAAVLFEGSANVCSDNGGATLLVLGQGKSGGALPRHAPAWRYALAPLEGAWTSGQAARLGHGFNAPFAAAVTDLHGGALPSRAACATLDAPGAIITGLRAAGATTGREGIVVHAFNPSPNKAEGTLRFILPLRQTAVATLDDLPGAAMKSTGTDAPISMNGFGIQSWWAMPTIPTGRIGSAPPAVRPQNAAGATLCKYWLHKTAPPFGAPPRVSVDIEGTLDENSASVRVRVGTIGASEAVQGVVTLTASDGLAVSPTQIFVHLEPGESQERDVALLWSGPAQAGSGIVAEMRVDSDTFREVIEYRPSPLKVETVRTGAQVRVRVTNPNALAADGFVDCVLPSNYWGDLAEPEEIRLSPRRQLLSVPAYETAEVSFTLSNPEVSPPMRAKVAANGHVVYADINSAAPVPPASVAKGSAGAPPSPRASAPPVEQVSTP